MRKKLLSLISVFMVLLTAASLLMPAAYAESRDEFTYTLYLNISNAYRTGDRVAGGVNTINVIVEYDSAELELTTDFSGSYKDIFPKFKESGTVVNSAPGRLGFNSLNISPYLFSKDSDVLARLSFRYKNASHSRARIRARITELATETAGGYVQLVEHDVYKREGIRLMTERTPDSASGMLLGDADGDGDVTIADSTCIQRHVVWLPTGDFVVDAADVDRSRKVTVIDATFIQRYVLMLPTRSGIGKIID